MHQFWLEILQIREIMVVRSMLVLLVIFASIHCVQAVGTESWSSEAFREQNHLRLRTRLTSEKQLFVCLFPHLFVFFLEVDKNFKTDIRVKFCLFLCVVTMKFTALQTVKLEGAGYQRFKKSYKCSNCLNNGHTIKTCTSKCKLCQVQVCCAHLVKQSGKWQPECTVL